MAVEQDFAGHPIQYGYAGRYLVDEHHVGADGAEKRQVQRGVHHARVTAQRVTPAEHRPGQPVADHRHRQCTVPGLFETVRDAVVIGDEPHGMAGLLHGHGRVDHQPFGTSDAQIRVQEDNVQFHRETSSSVGNMYLMLDGQTDTNACV